MADESPESPQRWTAKRRASLILSILKGETSAQAAARKHGLTVAEVEEWRDRFLLGAENALRARPKDEDALKDEQIKKLKQKVGELVLEVDILREAPSAFSPRLIERALSDDVRGRYTHGSTKAQVRMESPPYGDRLDTRSDVDAVAHRAELSFDNLAH